MNVIFVQILNMLHNIVKKIPYGRQSIFKEDLDEVVKSLSNDLITTGPYVKKFENNFSKNNFKKSKSDRPLSRCSPRAPPSPRTTGR